MYARSKPKETRKVELMADSADMALFLFINDDRFHDRDLFVACVVEGPSALVRKTLSEVTL
jgi:hypothetical protein